MCEILMTQNEVKEREKLAGDSVCPDVCWQVSGLQVPCKLCKYCTKKTNKQKNIYMGKATVNVASVAL